MPKHHNEGRGWLSNEDYTFIFTRVPRLCVDLIIKNRKGILLSRRDIEPAKNMWHIPGGRIKYGETIERAVVRVAKAELGFRVAIKKQLGFVESLRERQNGNVHHSVSLVFLAEPERGAKAVGSWQAREVGFFRKAPRNIYKPQREFLRRVKLLS